MAFDVTALSAYIEDQDFPLIAKMQATGGLADVVNIQSGIKGSSNLQFLSTDVIFGADSCTRTASGSTAFTQRTITVGAIAVSEDLCVKDLNGFWTQTLVKQGASGEEEMPGAIESVYMAKKMNAMQNALAKSDFQGDTGSGVNNLSYYDGLLKLVDADGTVIDGNTGGVTVATGVTVSNILAIIEAIWLARPDSIREKQNLSLWLPFAFYDLYISALKTANMFHYVGADGETKYYGTNLTLRPTVGLDGLNRMVLCADDNVTIGMDGTGDEDAMKVRLDPVSEKSIFFDATFKRGVQYAFGDEIVEFTLVP